MKKYKPIMREFKKTYKRKIDNSLNFENIGNADDYNDPDISFAETSVYGLKMYNIPLIDKYLQEIIDSSDTIQFDETQLSKYYMNPYLISKELYEITDYWYLILAVNNYKSVESFKGFTSLLAPDKNLIEAIVNELEKK